MNKTVYIIILNWNNYADTKECLDSLSRIDHPNYKVIVVDNGSTDGSIKLIETEYPDHEYIKNRENAGFAEGNDIAIKKALQEGAELILLLNNDTVVEPDFLSKLVAQCKEGIGIISPKIMFYQNKDKIWFAGGGYLPILGKPYHLHYEQADKPSRADVMDTEWVSGCCMLITKEMTDKIGLLDTDYFFNCEDVDLCWRAKRAGFRIILVPGSKMSHKFASSTGGKISPIHTYYRTRNLLLFFRKTKQIIPLILNFTIYPIYSILTSALRFNIPCIIATLRGVSDFVRGKYGKAAI